MPIETERIRVRITEPNNTVLWLRMDGPDDVERIYERYLEHRKKYPGFRGKTFEMTELAIEVGPDAKGV